MFLIARRGFAHVPRLIERASELGLRNHDFGERSSPGYVMFRARISWGRLSVCRIYSSDEEPEMEGQKYHRAEDTQSFPSLQVQ